MQKIDVDIVMYLARKYTDMNLEDIAEILGGIKGATVSYGANKILAKLKSDRNTRRLIEKITEKF